MSNEINIIKDFRRYAENKLNNHLDELYTRYQNKPISSDELQKSGFTEHKKIYSNELEEKIRSLLPQNDNTWLKTELDTVKDTYIDKLSPDNSHVK